jgi:hypothetical protein
MARQTRRRTADERPAEELRAERRTRALETPLDLRLRADPRFVHLEVRNPIRRTHYDVLFPAYPARDGGFCTCTDYARRGVGTCKHLEAAWLWLAEHPPAPTPPAEPGEPVPGLWDEVDRRLRGLGRSRLPEPIRVRWAGAALTADPR